MLSAVYQRCIAYNDFLDDAFADIAYVRGPAVSNAPCVCCRHRSDRTLKILNRAKSLMMKQRDWPLFIRGLYI